MRASWVVLLIAGAAGLSCGESAPPPPTATAIVGVRLIDGSGSDPVDDTTLVVEGRRILQLGPSSEVTPPEGAEVIDGAGLTVMPGLIDLHVHYSGDRAEIERLFRAQLAYGVTTARSIGTDNAERFGAIRDAREGRLRAPRVYTAGLGFSHPQGHPIAQSTIRRPPGPEEARKEVRELAESGVDFVKIWVDSKYGELPKITPEVQQAIVEEASRNRLPVVAHIYDEEDARRLVSLGVTDFLHVIRDQEGVSESQASFFKDNSVSFAPTLTVIESNWLLLEQPELLDADPRMREALSAEAKVNLAKAEWRETQLAERPLDVLREELERAQRFVREAYEAGVWLALGSDSGAGTIPTGWGSHRELQLLVEAGLEPLAALHIATGESARRLGKRGADIGVLEAGKLADLILLEADPSADIRNTTRIRRVMKSGAWVDASASGKALE